MKKIKIFIADDHPVIRNGFRSILSYHDFSILGEADNGPDTIEMVLQMRPDILIADITMPGGLSIEEIIKRILDKSPHILIIVFTMHHNQQYALNALRAGAKGYVLKGSDIKELIDAINTVFAGNRFISPLMANMLLNDYMGKGHEENPLDLLSERQKEVLRLSAEGNKIKEIAHRLGLSTVTIKKHKSNIMRKFNLKNSADLIKLAIMPIPLKLTSRSAAN